MTPKNDECVEQTTTLCSVLNVVIDHAMESPSPLMEPEEWEQFSRQKDRGNPIKVPVIRVFGPCLRNPNQQPLQSACLYIHGAFPYLLARPVMAGPDGSLRRADPSSGQVNWDDSSSVERIVDMVASTLESALQSMDMYGGNDSKKQNKPTSKESHQPIVRRITVVEGRGFYTYCPGPPAPFLRVEYYNPSLRWKVKLLLERGLELPLSYHPDPLQYDRTVDLQPNDNLKFNCYEAHIPYTMQFFKDWNLAGMSYIHIARGKLRGKLPEKYSFKKHTSDAAVAQANKDVGDAVFLRSNTPKEVQWGEPKQSCEITPPLQQPSNSSQESRSTPTDFQPPKKETSCDVEIDCTVADLRNVEAILKTLPSEQEDRDQIQWRAVPSLQEVWRQERSRMAKLLQPEHDFLSHPAPVSSSSSSKEGSQDRERKAKLSTPPFTLNVKKDAARSGARLATKGMWKLVRVTYGLQEDFIRSLTQIVKRHKQAVMKADVQIQQARSIESTVATVDEGKQLSLTPTFHEAIDALDSLAKTGTVSEHDNTQSDDETEPSYLSNLLDTQAMEHSHASVPIASYSSSQEVNDNTVAVTMDPILYSQRMDRGDCIVDGPCRDLEDYVDPETLLPYEYLDFGEDRCRAIFIVETDSPGTTRICGAKASFCARNHTNPNTRRARPGCYKTVTTGKYVDGMVNSSSNDFNDEQDEEDNEAFEKYLSLSATQVPDTHRNPSTRHTKLHDRMVKQAQSVTMEQVVPMETSGRLGNRSINLRADTIDESIEDSADESYPDNNLSVHSRMDITPIDGAQPPHVFPAFVTPNQRAPERRQTMNQESRNLLFLESKMKAPSWLVHSARYNESQQKIAARKKRSLRDTDNQMVGAYSQSVLIPPNRGKVAKWYRKRTHEKSLTSKVTGRQDKKIKAKERVSDKLTSKVDVLEIDSNSRQLVPKFQKTKPAGDNSAMLIDRDIEEVQWQSSQKAWLSMTQSSQQDSGTVGESLNPHPPLEKEDTNIQLSQNIKASSQQGNENREYSASASPTQSVSQNSDPPLKGIGNQGGRIHIEGGGRLKARIRPTQPTEFPVDSHQSNNDNTFVNTYLPSPISFMSIEIHVQCRTGVSRLDSKKISMAPDSNKDKIWALVYVYGRDPGGGESIDIISRGCIFVPLERRDFDRDVQAMMIRASMPRSSMGISVPLTVESAKDERSLLLRLASIVRMKDPDMLISWDTQGSGLGYIIERGVVLGNNEKGRFPSEVESSSESAGVDMVRLLGRTPNDKAYTQFLMNSNIEKYADPVTDKEGNSTDQKLAFEGKKFRGSGLGSDWDERVGAGAAAASIVGRLVFAGWKIVAEEVKHANASYLPAVVAAVLGKRIPNHEDLILTQWYAHRKERWRVLNHRLSQATACLLLFDALDIIGRAGEAARLSGVEFSQSFPGIRGSQYKVEGVLLRALRSLRSDERGSKKGKEGNMKEKMNESGASIAYSSLSSTSKSPSQSPWKLRRGHSATNASPSSLENRHYFFYSPSLEDTNKQEALEVQALTLEPQSGHYQEPVVVCDFTALYPSLVIAYNLCYSTCVGKLEYHSTRKEMQIEGRTSGRVGPFLYPERRTATVLTHHLKSCDRGKEFNEEDLCDDRVYIAPTGTLYVAEDVLKGVLPQVLDEILTTRAMLKRAAKEYKKRVKNISPAVLRQLEARQLALKYVANVTYGYTSATFSGRCAMPLLADTIVECGRKTLRKAIDLANKWGRDSEKWRGCRVIYGDTDSLFVKLPGRSYKEAFEFGEELCQAVTADNPPPVQLKLEKVYLGSIMQTMKRYCGMKFESKTQKKPVFEAKGLETVRRDQCSLTQKVLRNALIALFQNGSEAVKNYLFRQWSLIFAGQLPVSEFILTGRVRSRYRGGREGPVQAVLARRMGEADPGRIIRHKERLPYVIVATPGVTFRLKDCVLSPLELLERWDAYTIHSAYYIEKHVNASLQRCLGLAPHFIDVNAWYQECPKPRRRIHFWPVYSRNRAMITSYFGSDVCSLCERRCQASGRARVVVCEVCRQDRVRASQKALAILNRVQILSSSVANECSRCNKCFESSDTFATIDGEVTSGQFGTSRVSGMESIQLPLANCSCIDCPNTFKRHRLREQTIEAYSACDVLGLE